MPSTHRRTLAALSLCAFAAMKPADASAQRAAAPVGIYLVRGPVAADARDAVTLAYGGRTRSVQLGAQLQPQRALLFSEDNGNTRFQLMLWFERASTGVSGGALVLPSAAIDSGGFGGDNGRLTLSFQLTAPQATEAAAILHIARQDRRPVATHIAGAWAPSQPVYTRGQAPEVVLTLQNPASGPAVQRNEGGRNRGVRDNQFTLTVTRDGHPVTAREGYDFGGLSHMPLMSAGASVELRARVGLWADVSVPGRYEVQCAYETDFAPEGARHYEDTQRGALFTREFRGTVRFEVR